MISVQCGSQLSGVSHSVLGTLLPVCLREVPSAPRALPLPCPSPATFADAAFSLLWTWKKHSCYMTRGPGAGKLYSLILWVIKNVPVRNPVSEKDGPLLPELRASWSLSNRDCPTSTEVQGFR